MAKNAVTRDGVNVRWWKQSVRDDASFSIATCIGRPRRSETAATEKKRSRNNVPRALDCKFL